MIWNYLLLTIRHLKKQKITSIVYIASLSVGLAFFILIFLFIKDELTFDQFHKNANGIYNVVETDHFYNFSSRMTPIPLAEELSVRCSDVENYVRITWINGIVKMGDQLFNERIHLTDIQFFDIFSFSLKSGDPKTVLQSKNSIVLTENYAQKFFGNKDPIGETVTVILNDQEIPFIVSAILDDPPKNSTIQFNLLTNIFNLNTPEQPAQLFNWNRGNVETYLLLKDGANIELIRQSILSICKSNRGSFYDLRKLYSSLTEKGETFTYHLQSLPEMHLESSSIYGTSGGNINKSYFLLGIALFMLSIGIINFLNISLAKISGRSLEIGLRKVFGANKKQFIYQFWAESIAIAFIAFFVGCLLAFLLLPVFNQLVVKNLSFNTFFNPLNIILFGFIIVIIGVISGSYPAIVMSNFRVVDIFKGKMSISSKRVFQKGLLLFQYVIAIFFIISALTVNKQLNFIKNYDLGFQKNGIIAIQLQGRNVEQNLVALNSLKNRIKDISTIKSISGCETTPNRTVLMGAIEIEGKRVDVHLNRIDFDYIKTMEMNIVEGRDYSNNIATDTFSIIINQKLAREFEGSPIGKNIRIDNQNIYTVIGVVKDYNFLSLRDDIKPTILSIGNGARYNYALVRIAQNSIAQTIEKLDEMWREIYPQKIFMYSFIDDDLNGFYKEENRLNTIIKYSSILIVVITCMGIFGLTLYVSNQRIREFGIRKVVGATNLNIIELVVKNMVTLIFVGILITWPISYYFMTKWLEKFAYKTSLDYLNFIYAGLFLLIVSLLTIIYIAIKAALKNPINSLKNE